MSARDGLVSEYVRSQVFGQAVVIGIGRGDRGGRGQQARDEQDGREGDPRMTMPRSIHARIVRPARPDGNASVVPAG